MNVATQRGSGDDQMVLYSNEIDIVNVQRQVLFTDVADLTILKEAQKELGIKGK